MRTRRVVILVLVLALLIGARTISSWVIDYHWWGEMGQVSTWIQMILYSLVPAIGVALLAFAVFWTAHARGVKFSGTRLRDHTLYARLTTLGAAVLAILFAAASVDNWTVVRFFGGRQLTADAAGWRHPVFGHALAFYLFDLPFYSLVAGLLVALSLAGGLIYWLAARGWQLRSQISGWKDGQMEIELADLQLKGALRSAFLRGAGALFLLALAARFWLGRFSMLSNEHGFLVGVDYVDEKIALPLQWLLIVSAVAAALSVALGRLKPVLVVVAALIVQGVVPRLVSAVYVRPNEISLQRPYIQRHIQATRSAFGLLARSREVEFAAKIESKIDMSRHKPLFDNVRLWDWRAFHDTVTQIQALRPYYVFNDSDVDRYVIDGQLRQVLLTPRELDIRQVADAGRWINSHFIYTHGFGMVMAEANQITPEGMPVLFIKDAPPQIQTKSLKLTRPEIYYGEVVHEPVFVRTGRDEFNYPSGSDNVHSRYHGTGGFPVSSLGMRLAAAIARGDWNILLTGYLAPESRMMIHRKVAERLEELAGFLHWDADPYLVLTAEGRLVWIVDGYTTSDSHPYSRLVNVQTLGTFNYIRNSVKATVDAYDGTTRLYVFDPADPIIQAYRKLFPNLMVSADQMPADLRAHARYPEMIFRAQAEMYRTYHMLDPDSFYNKEDLWDIARSVKGQENRPEPLAPTYVVATLPGEQKAEFLLIVPFTPRAKDNLIGLMAARCDGEHLGELVFLQLSKQELIFGPMQIEARINQDQTISKDLTLWNQQGSQVLRGQMLVLPVENTFVYIEPIYIQASQARMPQLKKIAVTMGNTLVYTDSWEQAVSELARLAGSGAPAPVTAAPGAAQPAGPPPAAGPPGSDRRIELVRQHLERYRSLAAQGKWAEAGKELEAVEAIARGR
ncbi:MAG: UPF0182 family protein [Acidobacteria bacterium]|nr:UPF0182 family protein [Acidobacteriota bacterium]